MALGIEFANVIVRTADAELMLTGELDRFAAAQHNYIEDEHLLRDTLAALKGDVEVRRTAPGEHGHDRYEIVRGDALIDLDLVHAGDTLGLWATRRQNRNRRCHVDIELLEWLRTTLEAAGARS